jgi:XTP/dITP diphosphohydrolase
VRVIVATNNPGKLAELRGLLPSGVDLLALADVGLPSPEEPGDTFAANALIKARAAAPFADGAFADDSGLVVDALGGEPGVRSARYAGEHATDAENNAKLLREVAARNLAHPAARFVCAAAYVSASGQEWIAEGIVEGTIISCPRGSDGFGYDPIFEIHDLADPQAEDRTLAELTLDDKNRISHRSRAVRALVAELSAAGVLQGRETRDAGARLRD